MDYLNQWLRQLDEERQRMATILSQKSFLIVHLNHVDEAKQCFEQTVLKIVGRKRHLGGFLGDETTMKEFVHKKSKISRLKLKFDRCSQFLSLWELLVVH